MPSLNESLADVTITDVGDGTLHDRSIIVDPASPGNQASVQQFHNADNQALSAMAYGILTGGVAQLINILGYLDRQRETGTDGIPAVGIATGVSSFAQSIATTATGSISAGTASATITPAAMKGVQVGAVVQLDSGANQEPAVVTALPTASTATVTFGPSGALHAHSGTYALTTFVYNQERDAAGELDGASGTGTNVAAEYEFNSGGPPLAAGTPSGNAFDRGRNVQGKGVGAASITSTSAGNSSIVFSSAAQTNTLLPGTPVYLYPSASAGALPTEVVYVASSWTPGSSTTVPLQSPVVNSGSVYARWDQYIPNGPATAGFLPSGIGIESAAIWDVTSNLFTLIRGLAGAMRVAITGGATLNRGQVSVGTSATQLVAANTSRYSIVLCNTGGVAVYLGPDNTVTTANGHALPAGGAVSLNTTSALYAVAASGTQTVTYLEEAV